MFDYSDKSHKHDVFGESTQWEQADDAVPKDLAGDKFEERSEEAELRLLRF